MAYTTCLTFLLPVSEGLYQAFNIPAATIEHNKGRTDARIRVVLYTSD
jgi:hypothetical protein